MNLLFDLKEILYDNKDLEHEMSVTVTPNGVRVELIYPSATYSEEDTILPIVYDNAVEFAYIPDKDYREKYIVNDYGIYKLETKLAFDIMSYLEAHGAEICEMCDMFGLYDREQKHKLKLEKAEIESNGDE